MKTEQEIVRDFINEHQIAVISTVTSDFLPNSAVVGIWSNPHMEIFFGTFKSSRKYENILKNPRVSLVIGWDMGKTVQYEGQAKKLSGKAEEEFKKAHLAHMSTAAKYVSREEAIFFKVTPSRIKYSDVSKDPWDIIELAM